MRNIKNFFSLLLTICIPGWIFLCPIQIAYSTGNFWYIFLFIITWFPALLVAKFIVAILDL